MFKKIIIIVVAIIVIAGVGYWGYQYLSPTPSPEDETKDEIVTLLENLQQETGISFTDIQTVNLNWNVKKYEKVQAVTIEGKGFAIEGTPSEQYMKIESFFQSNGFEVDVFNIAAGTVAELTGYKKDYTVCTVVGSMWLDEKRIPLETGETDVEVRCGKGDSSIDLISKEETIETEKGNQFSVVLETNPTTGYEWELDFDFNYIRFTGRKYVSASPEMIGSGGHETFNFRTLKSGETEIIFSYLRSWETEKPPIETKSYKIIIK